MAMTRTHFGGRTERYRLRGGASFEIEAGARDELASRIMVEGIHPAALEIATICNTASSWGGYEAFLGDQVARVTGINAGSSERGRRLLGAVDRVNP